MAKKKGRGVGKGSSFERALCKKLSLWWTDGATDDIFWRTSGSGARATVRGRKNKRTFGQSGDIQATDPIGQPFIDAFCIEAKRGRPAATMSNILDASETMKQQELLTFIEQAERSRENAGAWSWMIIHKRDQRQTTVTIPYRVMNELTLGRSDFLSLKMLYPKHGSWRIVQMKLDDFLAQASRKTIKRIGEQHGHYKPSKS